MGLAVGLNSLTPVTNITGVQPKNNTAEIKGIKKVPEDINIDKLQLQHKAFREDSNLPVLSVSANPQATYYVATMVGTELLIPEEAQALYQKFESTFKFQAEKKSGTEPARSGTYDPGRVSIAVLLSILLKILPELNLTLDKARQTVIALTQNFETKVNNASYALKLGLESREQSYLAAHSRMIGALTSIGVAITSGMLAIANSANTIKESNASSAAIGQQSQAKQAQEEIAGTIQKIDAKKPDTNFTLNQQKQADTAVNTAKDDAKVEIKNKDIIDQGPGQIKDHKELNAAVEKVAPALTTIKEKMIALGKELDKVMPSAKDNAKVSADDWIKDYLPLRTKFEALQQQSKPVFNYINNCEQFNKILETQTMNFQNLYSTLIHGFRSGGDAASAIGDANATQKSADAEFLNVQARVWGQNSDAYGKVGDDAIDSWRKTIQDMQETLIQILREITTLLVRIRKPN